jgi:hypothetical protein
MTDKTTIRAWYVSPLRLLELLDVSKLPPQICHALSNSKSGINGFAGGILANFVGPHILESIRKQRILPFHLLAIQGKLVPGTSFIYQGHLYGKGFGETNRTKQVSLSENVDDILPGRKLVIEFSKDGLTTETAKTRLNGSVNMFAYCSIIEASSNVVRSVPYVIGDLVEALDSGIDFPFQKSLKLDLGAIDQFKTVDFQWNPSPRQFQSLKTIPEVTVKTLFCKLFSEVQVPNDWGGEECDLFTSNISIRGSRCCAAFLLKGPAKFHEMTPADCGKNGDQICRLFNTSADLYVLQHCHRINPMVRKTVEAFALAQYSRTIRYALIDGYDTCRILKANGLLPHKSTRRPTPQRA